MPPIPNMPKGFIEVDGIYHSDESSSHPESYHLINVQHITCVERTENNYARIKLNGYWLETKASYDEVKALIKDAQS